MVQNVLCALELIFEWTEMNCFPPIFGDFPSFCSVLEKELFVKVACITVLPRRPLSSSSNYSRDSQAGEGCVVLLIGVLTLRFLSFDALMLEFPAIPSVLWDRLISCHWFG